ncbi:MAG TPA: glucose-6-phosphate isomerase, partial [Eubacteriaceae bacterium]|nr:glucose-6-phosphate isomerase [Eubacteriaceae bacterium]
IDGINGGFYNDFASKDEEKTEVYFAGQNISDSYLSSLLTLMEEKDFMINVISKSGTTTEPAIAFRLFKKLLIEKYGEEESKNRIFITTDGSKGAMKELADQEKYTTFVIPDDVGGRYSVHTPVGLLPMAAAGIDIDAFMKGANDAMHQINEDHSGNNPCYRYAASRNILNRKGKDLEILVSYEPDLAMFSEWWKQLFGESEGKDGKGIFPVSVSNSTDLHSLGQIIQQGKRNIFETVIQFDQEEGRQIVPKQKDDSDGLKYIEGKDITEVNKKAFEGTLLAHVAGDVPNLVLNVGKKDAYHLGYLVYFFERACGISGYLLGVNPFNQPGVEEYKRNMFALLGKKEYKDLAKKLKG